MSNDNSSTSGGIGLLGAIFLILLILKLTETGIVAKWSWWWVTAPLWGPVAIGLAILILYIILKVLAAIIK